MKMNFQTMLAGALLLTVIACSKSKDDAAPSEKAKPTPTSSETPSPVAPEAALSVSEATELMASVGIKFKSQLKEKKQKDGSTKMVAVWDQAFLRAFQAESAKNGVAVSLEDRLGALNKYIQAVEAHFAQLAAKSGESEEDGRVNADAEVWEESEDDRVNGDAEVWDVNNEKVDVLTARLEAAKERAASTEAKLKKAQETVTGDSKEAGAGEGK